MAKKQLFPDITIEVPAIVIPGSYIDDTFDHFVGYMPAVNVSEADGEWHELEREEVLSVLSPETFAAAVLAKLDPMIKSQFTKRNIVDTLYRLDIYNDSIASELNTTLVTRAAGYKTLVEAARDSYVKAKEQKKGETLKRLRMQAASLGFKLVKED